MGHWLWHLFLGGAAGFLVGKLMKGDGYGVFVDVILGLVGGWVGGWLFARFGLHSITQTNIGYFIAAVIGAAILVWLGRLIKSKV